ncbi:MAG: bile acid beta-glucosidase [Symploca sp. SIO2E6]|nr:bile acid beta-glucosidase [Symploca sp. SIO2E6]
MLYQPPRPKIPDCSWQRPLGLGWDQPYTASDASNLDDGPWQGMPVGGMGAGCISRSSRGDFNLWHLDGGRHTFRSLPACQFSVFEQPENAPAQAYALCTEPPEDGTLGAWQWYPAVLETENGTQAAAPIPHTGTYYALYPRSWFTYQQVFQTELTCEQFSPIWAGSYQENSYPIAIFEWTAHNPTEVPITLSIMLTWQNMVGWFTNAIKEPRVGDDGKPVFEYQPRWGDSTGNYNQWIVDSYRVGCLLDRVRLHDQIQEGEGQLCLATVTNPSMDVFYHGRWNPVGSGGELWSTFAVDGSLGDNQDETPAAPGEQIATAMAIRFTIRPGRTRKIPFILAWDFPITEFGSGVTYYRRYTDFFGRTGNNAWSMVRTALKHSQLWQERIQAWQEPIINRQDLPDWFKMALFNELYLLTSGGSLWTAADERDPVGQFALLESWDCPCYESLNLRLYSSFALVRFWPRLDKAVLEAFARAIPRDGVSEKIAWETSEQTRRRGDTETRRIENPPHISLTPRDDTIGEHQATTIRKAPGATPHDLGIPDEHPWERTNYSSYQDWHQGRDLPSNFVLQVYRDFVLTGSKDTDFLWECWSGIVETLAYIKTFDQDGDGIPEHSRVQGQTQLQGISAYCGGLWLAALEAAIAIGEILLNDYPPISPLLVVPEPEAITDAIALYRQWLTQAQPIYQQTLWNGQYYRLDSESGSDLILADQLCGQFYAQLLGLPDIVPAESAQSALKTVYDTCFLKFNDVSNRVAPQKTGCLTDALGAVKGFRSANTLEELDSNHPWEVFIGSNFGLAAFLIKLGMKEEAWGLTEAVVRQIYEHGLQFRTPEAITAVGTFRASCHLGGMGIWAVYLGIEN